MSPRTIRRANERKALKQHLKQVKVNVERDQQNFEDAKAQRDSAL